MGQEAILSYGMICMRMHSHKTHTLSLSLFLSSILEVAMIANIYLYHCVIIAKIFHCRVTLLEA